MKRMKFSGRELAVLRAINFSTGNSGSHVLERTNLDPEDALDILNGLLEIGYIEMNPPSQRIELFALFEAHFEINPAYAHDLKDALLRR